jgi:hypothetical protein
MAQNNQFKPKEVEPEAVQETNADKKPVDQAVYNKFTDLKFIELSGAKMTEKSKEEIASLEAELKKCTGRIAKITVRAAIRNEQALMVAGIPVPASIETLVKSNGSEDYYFEK